MAKTTRLSSRLKWARRARPAQPVIGGRASRLPARIGSPIRPWAPITAISIWTKASAADQTSICRSNVMSYSPLANEGGIVSALASGSNGVRGVAGQLVGAVVLGMARMALDPAPLDRVRRRRLEQLLPEFGILDRLAVGGPPAVAPPAVDPFGDAVADVDAVGMEDDVAGLGQRLEGADRGE